MMNPYCTMSFPFLFINVIFWIILELYCQFNCDNTEASCHAHWLTDVLYSNQQELRVVEKNFRKAQFDADLITYCFPFKKKKKKSKFSFDGTGVKTSLTKETWKNVHLDPCKLHSMFLKFFILSILLHPPPWLLTTLPASLMRRFTKFTNLLDLPLFVQYTIPLPSYILNTSFFIFYRRVPADSYVQQSYHLATGLPFPHLSLLLPQ